MPGSVEYIDSSFGERGAVVYRHNGPRQPNGWSSHVETLPNGRDLACVGAVPQGRRPGAPMSLACLLLNRKGKILNVTVRLPDAGEVADVVGAQFVADSEWLVVAGNTTHLMRPFLCRINVRTGEYDTAFENHFNAYMRDARSQGGGFRLDGLLIDTDESVLVSGTMLRQTHPGAMGFVIRLHPDGSPRSLVGASDSAQDSQRRWVSAMTFTESRRIAAVVGAQADDTLMAGLLFLDTAGVDPECTDPQGVVSELDYVHACSWYDGESVIVVGSVGRGQAQHAAVATISPTGEYSPSFSMDLPDGDFRGAITLADDSVLLVGNRAGDSVVALCDLDGDWDPTFPGEGFAVLPLKVPATDVALTGGRVVINHCSAQGSGLVLTAVPMEAPRPPPPRPVAPVAPVARPTTPPVATRRPVQVSRSTRANPYAGMSEAQLSAKATDDHLRRMSDLNGVGMNATSGMRFMGW
jgi:hypothetical protein